MGRRPPAAGRRGRGSRGTHPPRENKEEACLPVGRRGRESRSQRPPPGSKELGVPEAAGPVPSEQRAAAGPPVARAERPNANDQPKSRSRTHRTATSGRR